MWITNKAFLQGQLHYEQNRRCEDFAASFCREGIISAAVSDGAGTLSESADGAMMAAKTASRYIAENSLIALNKCIHFLFMDF